MAVLSITNNMRRPIEVGTRRDGAVTILDGASATLDVPVPNVRRLLRWARSRSITITTPGGVVLSGGSLDFSNPANSGHIPGI